MYIRKDFVFLVKEHLLIKNEMIDSNSLRCKMEPYVSHLISVCFHYFYWEGINKKKKESSKTKHKTVNNRISARFLVFLRPSIYFALFILGDNSR